jgi:hypothetical protein
MAHLASEKKVGDIILAEKNARSRTGAHANGTNADVIDGTPLRNSDGNTRLEADAAANVIYQGGERLGVVECN